MDSFRAGGGSSLIIPSMMRRKCFYSTFICTSCSSAFTATLKVMVGRSKPEKYHTFFFKWLNWQGWIWCNMEDLAFSKLTSDCFLTQCDIIQYIMAVQKWHHLHYWSSKSLICSMLNRLVLTLFYFLREIRANNIQLEMSHYHSARRVTVRV